MDDVCVATESWSEHLSILEKVVKLVIRAKLKSKGSKCVFGTNRIIFLGHRISKKGLQQNPNKLKALLKLPKPKNVPELRRCIGIVSYYRRFVPNYSIIAEPLLKLLKKNVPYNWADAQDEAFSRLIEALGQNACLAHFNNNNLVILKTDASKKGVAAILLQRQNGDWRIVCCCSRRLTNSESNYGITDLEGLAVIYSVTKFRCYLLGREFRIVVDHYALCALNSKLPSSPRLKRWAIILYEFDFQIVYTKGTLHKDVDCLSRAPISDADDHLLDEKVYAVLIAPLDVDEWISNYDTEEAALLNQKGRDKSDKMN